MRYFDRLTGIAAFIFCIYYSFYSDAQTPSAFSRLWPIEAIKSDSIAMIALEKISREKLSINEKLEVNLQIIERANLLQQFNKAITLGNESLAIAQENTLDSLEAAFLKALGNSHYYINQLEKAITYFEKAKKIAHENNFWFLEAMCYNNIAGAMIDLQKHELPESYLLKTIEILNSHGMENNPWALRSTRILGTFYAATAQHKKAEQIFLRLIKKSKEVKDTILLADALLFYSSLLNSMGETGKAVAMSEEALVYTRKHYNFHEMLAALSFHAANLEAAGKYKEAYYLMRESILVQRKSFAKDLDKQMSEVEVKYKTKQLEQENELAEIRTKKQRQIYLFSSAGIILLLLSVFYIINQKRNTRQKIVLQKQKLESLIEGEEQERSRIAKDLHDGIVQDLTAIRHKVEQSQRESSEIKLSEISGDIDRAAKEVRDIAYQMMPVALREFGLIPALEGLLQKTLIPNNIQYDFEKVHMEERLPEKIEVCLYRITQELLNNVIKHSAAKYISVMISMHQNMITFLFEDNGTGFNEEESKKGIGMSSIASRLEMVHGEFKLETAAGRGTMAIIKIPLSGDRNM